MRVRIEEVDSTHEAHVYEANMDDLHAVADHCKRLQNDGLTGNGEMRHLATVPAIIVQQYLHTQGITYADFMRNPEHATRMLNDPALSAFRVSRGRV